MVQDMVLLFKKLVEKKSLVVYGHHRIHSFFITWRDRTIEYVYYIKSLMRRHVYNENPSTVEDWGLGTKLIREGW
uniref:Uncharacterized protein n=1 Tax=Acrobeloides nanus TaxID=290746 RepID=A0A914DIJ4_9BILA